MAAYGRLNIGRRILGLCVLLAFAFSSWTVHAASVTTTAKSSTSQVKKKTVHNTLSQKNQKLIKKTKKRTKVKRASRTYKAKELKKSIRRAWDFQDPSIKTIPKIWEPVSGEWNLIAEPEHPGNRVLQQKSVKRNFQYLMSKQQFVNFEFSAKMRTDMFEQKTSNWQMGLIFRQADPNYYYKFRITAANIALLRCSPQTESVLPSQQGNSRAASVTGRFGKSDENMLLILPWNATKDSWHTLTVVCYGERIILKLNGREIRMMDDGMIGSGKVGVFSYKTQAFFDDLRLFYLPVPDAGEKMMLSNDPFSLKKDRELLIYYKNPKIGNVEMNVLDPKKKMFAILTKGIHHQGMGSVVWNGQSFDGRLPKPGFYTIVLNNAGKKKIKKIKIKP